MPGHEVYFTRKIDMKKIDLHPKIKSYQIIFTIAKVL